MKALLLLPLLLLAGCQVDVAGQTVSPAEDINPGETITRTGNGYLEVIRVQDSELGVVCYVTKGHQQGGISCLPRKTLTQ